MSSFNKVVFKDKQVDSLLEEIYINQKNTQKQILALIAELKPLINDVGDATLLVPLIKSYLDSSIKNDEQLIKMTAIIQKFIQQESTGDSNAESDFLKELRNLNNE